MENWGKCICHIISLASMYLPLHMRVLVHLGGINKMEKCISVTGRRKKSGPNKWFQNFKSVGDARGD